MGVGASPERAAWWLALVQSDRDWGPPLLIPLRYALRLPSPPQATVGGHQRHENGDVRNFLILGRKLEERAIIWILLCLYLEEI